MQMAARLLSEEEQFKRRKKMYPHLWQEKQWEEKLVSGCGLGNLTEFSSIT